MITVLHRLIGAVGRLLIVVGALAVAFAGFQFWGTGWAEARAQEELDDQFLAQLAFVEDDSEPDAEADTEPPVASEPFEPTPSVEARGVSNPAPMLDVTDIPDLGEAAGRIIIPAIGVDKTYVHGVGRGDLRKGPGHYPETAFPGQRGNAAIAGHRTTYGAPFFDLDKLAPGDEIIVQTLRGRFVYIVNEHETASGGALGHFIVDPTATWVLDDHGDSRLTLTACHPKRSAARRIVVTATLEASSAPPTPNSAEADVEVDIGPSEPEPAPAPVTDGPIEADSQSLDESLGWQPEHWPATVLWAASSAAVAMAGRLLGHRWRRVPAYTVTSLPFLVCLFICFTHLDRLLPAI